MSVVAFIIHPRRNLTALKRCSLFTARGQAEFRRLRDELRFLF
jgi:hypothetical protein